MSYAEVYACLKIFNRSSKKYLTVPDSKQNDVPAGIMTKCPNCKNNVQELTENLNVCFNCDIISHFLHTKE